MCTGQIRQKKENHESYEMISDMEKDNWQGEGMDIWGFFEAGEDCHLKCSLVQAGPEHMGRASRGQLAWYP